MSVCTASCVFANGRAIPFARRSSTCDDSSRVKALRGICLPKQGRARARAGEDRTIAWTKLAHPRALSRPTMPCPSPLFCSISANGACTDEHEADTRTLPRLPSRSCASISRALSEPKQLLCCLAISQRLRAHRGLPSSAMSGAKKRAHPSHRQARSRRSHYHQCIMAFSAPIFLSYPGRSSAVCWLTSHQPGIRWPYRRTCGFLARHACGSKLIPPPTLTLYDCFPLLSC